MKLKDYHTIGYLKVGCQEQTKHYFIWYHCESFKKPLHPPDEYINNFDHPNQCKENINVYKNPIEVYGS